MSPDRFMELVQEALDSLPEQIARALANVEVVVEPWPTVAQLRAAGLTPGRGTLFGLYEGIPLTNRTSAYNLVLPDRITIFQGPITTACRTDAAIRDEVRRTVMHELAHHFGIDDDRLEELGRY